MNGLAAPKNLRDFQRMLSTEERCRDYLFAVRWPDGFECAVCGSQSWHYLDTRAGVIECGRKHQTSVTAGTIMHKTRTPLCTWLYAAYLVSTLTPGISALQFQRQLGLTRYETAYQMLHKLRSALVAPDREPLKGEIEVDEAFIGGVEHGRPGRGAETKALVIVAVEIIRYAAPDPKHPDDPDAAIEKVRAGRVRMNIIPNAEAETLLPWVAKNVTPGATVNTDGWAGYIGLSKLGYDHRQVLQSHKGKKTGHYLPMVHLIISNLKRWLLGTYKGAVLPKHLPAYLNEFAFRFNRRFWRGPAFLRALGLATQAPHGWPEYETLYHAGESEGWAHPNPKLAHATDELAAAVLDNVWLLAPDDLQRWISDHRDELHAITKRALTADSP